MELQFSEDPVGFLELPRAKGAPMEWWGAHTHLSLHLFGLDALDFCKSPQVFFHRQDLKVRVELRANPDHPPDLLPVSHVRESAVVNGARACPGEG